MRWRVSFLFVALAGAVAANEAPLSYVMVECSAISHVKSIWETDPNLKEAHTDMAEAWFANALKLAINEGMAAPFETLTDAANRAEGKWLSQGETAVFTGLFRQWDAICKSISLD